MRKIKFSSVGTALNIGKIQIITEYVSKFMISSMPNEKKNSGKCCTTKICFRYRTVGIIFI